MRVLKQSTAATVMFGPYLDKTDGVTEETGLAGAATELSKAGGAYAAGPTLGTHDSDGWYPISLTTTHTNTLGDLTIKGHDNATHLPVWMHFTVLPANAYDGMVSGTGVGMRSDVQGWLGTAPAAVTVAGVPEVDVTHWIGTAAATPTVAGVPEVDITHLVGVAQSATDLKDFADDGYDPATNKVQGLVLADAVTTVNGLAANVITAAATAADFTTEIQSGLATAAALDTVDNFLDTEIAAILAAVDTEVAAIKAVTDLLPDAGALSSLATQASVNTIDDFLDTEIAAIKAKTDSLTFTVAGSVDANVQQVNDVTIVGNGSGTPFNV